MNLYWKNFFILILVISKREYTFCQNQFFWPDGKPFITKQNNVASHLDSIGIHCYHSFDYKKSTVFFYPLSKEPAFLLSENKMEIPLALKSYNHRTYVNSNAFSRDVKEMIEMRILDTVYALEVLGKPDNITAGEEQFQRTWVYYKYNLRLNFDFHLAVKHDIINYTKLKEYGIAINDFELNAGDIFTGFRIMIGNLKSKTIKYVWITATAYNPVDDVVATKTVKGIGPLADGDVSSWYFDNLFYSNVIDRVKITGLKLQYMDGTIKVIPNSDVAKLFID